MGQFDFIVVGAGGNNHPSLELGLALDAEGDLTAILAVNIEFAVD